MNYVPFSSCLCTALPTAINDLLLWYKASGIQAAVITIPLVELLIFFPLLTVCLLLRFSRTGLIIAFLFTYRWGWLFCLYNTFLDQKVRNLFLTGYIVSGIIVLTMMVISLATSYRASSDG